MTQPAPAAEGQVDTPEGEGQATWYNEAPDEVKGYIQNKGWDDPIKAVTSYQELEKYQGANEEQLLKLPKDFEEEGALDPIYDRLGRPESAEGYEVTLPENVQADQERLNGAREIAHKLGLSQKQFEALAAYDAQYMHGAQEEYLKEQATKQEAEYRELRNEWGSNADEREELSRRGLRALLPEGDKEAMTAAIEQAIGTAATLKLFANAGERFAKEDKIHDSGNDKPFGYTTEQAKADKKALMDELEGDKERLNIYNQGKGADYSKMNRLNTIIAS